MMTDPISDLLIRIKNGYLARQDKVVAPHSRLKTNISKLLAKEGYVGKTEVREEEKGKKSLIIELLYEGKKPKLTNVVRVSKPGRKIYVKKDKIPKVLSGLGEVIISTPLGVMTGREAKKKGLGGEVICKIW